MKTFGRRQLLKWLPVFALGNVLFAAGCGDDDATKPADEFSPPTNLTYVNDDGLVRLAWTGSADASLDDFAGYQVYRSATSLTGATDEQLTEAELNMTLIDPATSYVDGTAANGVKYFYSVRAKKTNGDVSESTNEIDTAARPSGDAELAEFRDKTRNSAIDLSEGETYAFVIENLVHVDFYLGTAADDEATNQPLTIKSPSLVESDNPQWTNRVALFKLLESDDAATTSNTGFTDSITLGTTDAEIESKVIAVRLPLDENNELHYGKLIIDESLGEAGQRSIKMTFAYQPIPNYIRF